ncbi:MAG: S24 family peptidase [Pseudomonadota bacterium]
MHQANVEKLARALGTTPSFLTGDTFSAVQPVTAKTLPVLGRAAASAIGSENIIEDPIEWMPLPTALVGVRDAYALLVEGDSMMPLYKPRDPIAAHPRQPVSPGDIIVIQEERDGAIYASVKEFVRKTDTELVALQYNPPAELKFKLKHIRTIHRILPWRELIGI